jgi:ectoine hydroxylase-related dioxygenase (phytanoyl-CoA dioxygenase family)
MKTWYWILVIIIVSIVLRFIKKQYTKRHSKLNKHGFQVLDCLSESDVTYLKQLWNVKENKKIKKFLHENQKIQQQVQELLGPHYVFQDYILLIEKSRIHTCHRDNNAQQFNPDQKHPSYTIIFYLEEMERCLDVIPKSDKSTDGIFLTDETKSIRCRPGNAVLFNSGLIHSGSVNDKPNNKRIQMKLTHRDDLETIGFFQDYNKTLDRDNNNSEYFTAIQKHLSCQVPVLSDLAKNTAVKPVEKIFSKIFYGDENFYDLKDVK